MCFWRSLVGSFFFVLSMLPCVVWGEDPVAVSQNEWEKSASLSLYVPPDESAFLLPVVTADRGAWHLEGRYNYEARDTTSLWTGWTLSGGHNVTVEATPLLGVVFGDTNGVAPGLEMAVAWEKLEFTVEAEYLFDSDDPESDYFYNWSELSYYPSQSFRFGVVGQRTRVVNTDREIQMGPLAGYEKGRFHGTAYLFNLGTEDIYPVLTIGIDF